MKGERRRLKKRVGTGSPEASQSPGDHIIGFREHQATRPNSFPNPFASGFRLPHPIKSNLEHAVRWRHMEFVVSLLVSRSEEDLEGIALDKRREVQRENVLHDVCVVQVCTDHEGVVLAGYGDPAGREGGFGLRKPRLAVVPEVWRICGRISFQSRFRAKVPASTRRRAAWAIRPLVGNIFNS